jgi:hypothetical protein
MRNAPYLGARQHVDLLCAGLSSVQRALGHSTEVVALVCVREGGEAAQHSK